jgi:predicted amidohydrolase YtcJ
MSEHADLIISNGRLITFDPDNATASALAISGNRIVAVGSGDDVSNLKGPDTRVHDARGGTVMPGFIDSHVHLFMGSTELENLDLTGVHGLDALTSAVRAYAASRPDDRLVFAVSAAYDIIGPGQGTTRHHLDQALPDRAFAMMAPDHHTVWANTKALEMAGILDGGPVPEGSEIVMGDDGRAAGELLEVGAFAHVTALSPYGGREAAGYVTGDDPEPAATADQRAVDRDVIARGLKHCAAQGITTLHNMDGNFYQLELLRGLDEEGRLAARVQVPFHLKNFDPVDRIAEADEMRRQYSGDRVWSGRVKMFMDGVIESYTALMLEPYPDRPDTVGEELFSPEHFNEACVKADAMGLQISVHAIGDAAVRQTLDGYQAAREANGARDARHRVEHIEVLHANDLPRFAEMGVIASMQPRHSPRGDLFGPPPDNVILRPDQHPLAFPWQTIRESGATLVFSTDWPVVPVDVMPTVKSAVHCREMPESWGEQRQSLLDTLAAYTRDNAYCEFTEDRKGRLEAGMLADVVVMSEDLEAMDPAALTDAHAVLTVCDGVVTHDVAAD